MESEGPILIDDGLFVGGIQDATVEHLCRNKITAVVSALKHPLSAERSWPRRVRHMKVPVEDSEFEDISAYFNKTIDFISREIAENGNVLIHCVDGTSTSVALALAFLVAEQRMTLRAAFLCVRRKHPTALPNNGFFEQLIGFEKGLTGENTVHMITPDPFNRPEWLVPDVALDKVPWTRSRIIVPRRRRSVSVSRPRSPQGRRVEHRPAQLWAARLWHDQDNWATLETFGMTVFLILVVLVIGRLWLVELLSK